MKQRLCEMTEGHAGRVLALEGGQSFQTQMSEIGLCPGCVFEVSGTGGGGRMLLLTNHGRIAIGHGMAEKILISPLVKPT